MKLKFSYIILMGLVLLAPAFTGCSAMSEENDMYDAENFTGLVVRGLVMDGDTSKPLGDIEVELSAYRKDSSLAGSNSVRTNSKGLYEVDLYGISVGWSFVVRAIDQDSGNYNEASSVISLEHDSPSFNKKLNCFIIDGNNLFLHRAGK